MARQFDGFMVNAASLLEAAVDSFTTVKLALQSSHEALFRSWIFVPIGILVILTACFGVDTLFKSVSVSFPASVACMILLFAALWLSEWVLGSHRTRRMVAVIEVPAGWSLRWINVLFTPTFITLPLSPSISGVEVGKIIAIFLVGFVVMFCATAYMTRGLQLLTGTSKKAHATRAEELGPLKNEIPITQTPPRTESPPQSTDVSAQTSTIALTKLPSPERSQEPAHIQPVVGVSPNDASSTKTRQALPQQAPLPLPRARLWAVMIQSNLNWIIYLALFIFVGFPVYYAAGYAMPLHLTFTVLMYMAAMSLPVNWRQYLHPVLVAALTTILGIWVLGFIDGQNLNAILTEYSTGLKYLQLWEHTKTSAKLPGAGDLFGTVLDASIVALALPMYQYRRELSEHFVAIILPNILLSIGSLYLYPYICFAIGISAERSLSFASRSLTLALATPATQNLGGDVKTVAAIAIMSGIIGALIGQPILNWLRIPEDDYVTRGVTLGANSSAVATALLLRTDPRAAALSSLSMSLFGTITVLFTSIPSIATAVKSLAMG